MSQRIDSAYDADRWRLVCTEDPWARVTLGDGSTTDLFKADPEDPFALLEDRLTAFRPLQVPVAVALGHLERLTDEELERLRADIGAEVSRRNAALVKEDDDG